MKARKLELKTVEMTDEIYNEKTSSFDTVKQGNFSYREILKSILMSPGPQGHNTSDEVIKSVSLYGRIKEELRKGKTVLLLDKEEYDYIISRMNNFKWAIAHSAVSDFVKYVRELAEVEVVENENATTPATSAEPSKA